MQYFLSDLSVTVKTEGGWADMGQSCFANNERIYSRTGGGKHYNKIGEWEKIHLRREVKRPWPFKPETINYSIGFAGWSRSVGAKTAREVLQKLKLYEEYPDYQDFLEGKEPMYQMVEQFEVPLRRLKDE